MAYKWLKFTAVVGNESGNTHKLPPPKFPQKLLFPKNFVTFVIGPSLPLTLCWATETEYCDVLGGAFHRLDNKNAAFKNMQLFTSMPTF